MAAAERHGARRRATLAEDHLAAGYGSDDEARAPRRAAGARGFGALEGDEGPRGRPSGQATADYSVRQSASGPKGTKTRYIESLWSITGPIGVGGAPVGAKRRRLAPSEVKPRVSGYERHCALLGWLQQRQPAGPSAPAGQAKAKSDFQLLRENHRFLRSAEDDDGSWEARLAQRYYERLFREYVICDLAGYREGSIGFRWRTEAEVVRGKGQFSCGHKRCDTRQGLRSYEVDFRYKEAGQGKRALVKARLCEDCAYKLHYRRIRAARRRQRREERRARRRKGEGAEEDEEEDTAASPSLSLGAAEEAPPAAARRADGESAGAAGAAGAAAEGAGGAQGEAAPDAEERRLLEALAWRGPHPETRSREDDFDEFLNDLFM